MKPRLMLPFNIFSRNNRKKHLAEQISDTFAISSYIASSNVSTSFFCDQTKVKVDAFFLFLTENLSGLISANLPRETFIYLKFFTSRD